MVTRNKHLPPLPDEHKFALVFISTYTVDQRNLDWVLNRSLNSVTCLYPWYSQQRSPNTLATRRKRSFDSKVPESWEYIFKPLLGYVCDASILVLVRHLKTISIPLVSIMQASFINSAVVLTFVQVHTSCNCRRNRIYRPFLCHQLGDQRLLLENSLHYRPEYHNRSKRVVH